MLAAGIIFADSHNDTMPELAQKRTVASIPFGGRYRLIDFALSNMVNSGINKIGVITKRNYQSLIDHIGSGKDWDLSRRNGGVIIFPPFGNYHSDILYANRLEALRSVLNFINKCQEDNIVLTDCDNASIINYEEALKNHVSNNVDITVVYQKREITTDLKEHMSLLLDKEEKIIDASLTSEVGSIANVSVNAWIIRRKLLYNLINDAFSKGATSFCKDIILSNIKNLRVYGHEHKGIFLHIDNMTNYFHNSMELLKESVRKQLFEQKGFSVYTKVRDSAPTKYGSNAIINNSFIADGCVIEGTVINSILFRGTKIGKNTVVTNSILMQDTNVLDGVSLNCVVTDKNVIIREHQNLSGCEKIPYYLSKGSMV